MIVFNVVPNDPLRKELVSKMSVSIMRMDEIPAYDIVSNQEHFTALVKNAESLKLTEKILKNISKEILFLQKEVLRYLKNYVSGEEAIEPVLTLWFYDNEKKAHGYIQKSIPGANGKPMKINKDFFKMLKGKNSKKTKLVELIVIDIMMLAYQLMHTDRYELVSLKEWEKEIKKGGGAL